MCVIYKTTSKISLLKVGTQIISKNYFKMFEAIMMLLDNFHNPEMQKINTVLKTSSRK